MAGLEAAGDKRSRSIAVLPRSRRVHNLYRARPYAHSTFADDAAASEDYAISCPSGRVTGNSDMSGSRGEPGRPNVRIADNSLMLQPLPVTLAKLYWSLIRALRLRSSIAGYGAPSICSGAQQTDRSVAARGDRDSTGAKHEGELELGGSHSVGHENRSRRRRAQIRIQVLIRLRQRF